jgi:hypothetical protein
MLKSFLRDRNLILLLLAAIIIRVFSSNEQWVEHYYTYGLYPYISSTFRWLFGWIPFSIGDIVYVAAFVFLVIKTWKFLKLLAKGKAKEHLSWILFRKYLKIVFGIYIIFNICWGLNYNRAGIASQLDIEYQTYSSEEVYALALVLQKKVNLYAASYDSLKRTEFDKNNKLLFALGIESYKKAENEYPYLLYRNPSIKPSLYTAVGHYFGFTGYYNPFTGEAQLKTSVPAFVKPFILCHEMAHQLGYGKENEANLVAFLAARASAENEFRYSAYYDVFAYTIRELAKLDREKFLALRENMHERFKIDYRNYLQYLYNNRNMVEPFVSDFYDSYLRLNNQPKGTATYNEVVGWLIAYMKKYGAEKI